MNAIPTTDNGLPRIYAEQPVSLRLDTKTDISTAHSTEVRICAVANGVYSAAPIFVTATVQGSVVVANIAGGVLTPGIYELRSWVIFSSQDHFATPGDPVYITVWPTA